MKCKSLPLLIVLTLTCLLSFTFPLMAAATSYFNGGINSLANNGADLTIETQNPYVSSGSSVSAWPMTCDGNVVGDYAQVGWLKLSSYTGPYYFYEYSYIPTGAHYQRVLGSATVGSNNDFRVGCDSSTMYFIINNTTYGTVALSTIPFDRNTVEFLGETHSASDQCPGSVSNPLTMGKAQYKSTSNSWYNTYAINQDSLGYGDLSTMRNNIVSGGSYTFEIWDSRY